MRTPCACNRFTLNPERANVVIDGVPRCAPWTCDKVKEHRQERALRRVPHADVEFDNVPEPYSKSAYAHFTDL